jgi:hypothetical protein
MFRPWMMAVVPAFALIACHDAPQAPTTTTGTTPTAPRLDRVIGVIARADEATRPDSMFLQQSDGSSITLIGEGVWRLARVVDAEVRVDGTWSADRRFEMSAFLVVAVGGRPAADGVLLRMPAEFTPLPIDSAFVVAQGYAIRLVNGSYRPLIDPPADLIAFLGQRVWVTGPYDAPPNAFGLIGN